MEAAADLLLSLARSSDGWSSLLAAVGVALTAPRVGADALAAAARARGRRGWPAELGSPALARVIDRLSGVADREHDRPPGLPRVPAALSVTSIGPSLPIRANGP